MGLLKEPFAKLKKGHLRFCCNQVWMKIRGRVPWNVSAICEIFRTDCLMGEPRTKGDLVNHLKDRSFHLVHWLNIIPNPRRISQESINLERKCSLEYSSVMYCKRREYGMETSFLWTLRSWKRWTHRKSMLKDSTLKRWYFLKVVKITNSRSQMEQWNLMEETRHWERPPWYGIKPISRRKSPRFPWRLRRVSTNHVFSRLISGCLWSTTWFLVHFGKLHLPPSRWTKRQLLHAEGRIISYFTEFFWRHQGHSCDLGCIVSKPHRWLLEQWWIKSYGWFMDRFPTVHLVEGKASRRIHVVQGEIDETATSRPDHWWPEI